MWQKSENCKGSSGRIPLTKQCVSKQNIETQTEVTFFFIFRDPLTGKRSSKHPYKPRFQKKNPADQSSTSASDSNSAVDGKLSVHQIFSYIRKQGVTF